MHEKFSPSRSANAAAQGSFLNSEANNIVEEAEKILKSKGGRKHDEPVE